MTAVSLPVCLALTVLALGAGVAGCGSGGGDGTSRTTGDARSPADRDQQVDDATDALVPYLVATRDVERTKPHTPERTLVVFWQAVQFRNATKAYALVSESARADVTRREFERDITFASTGFNSWPHVFHRDRTGGRADLAVNLLFYGENSKVTAITPLTFTLVNEGGAWRLADLGYFTKKAAEGRRAAPD